MEQQVVDAIILNAKTTTVSLTLDRGYPDQRHPNPSELPSRSDLFYNSAMQYHRLWKFAQAHPQQVRLVGNVEYAQRPRVSRDLAAFDRFFQRYAAAPIDLTAGMSLADPQSIQVQSVPNRLAELNHVATQIRQLVATGKYRYRDFLILTRHLDGYQTMIGPVFANHQIPVFNDHERRMDKHPLVVLLTTLLQIPLYGYQTADIIQLLKTWLLLPAGEEIAARIYERHKLLTRFFIRLGVTPEVAAADACKIEHDLSDETFQKIKEHAMQGALPEQ